MANVNKQKLQIVIKCSFSYLFYTYDKLLVIGSYWLYSYFNISDTI